MIKVPNQLARLSRSIYDRKFCKSREWENWLLYFSLPVLKDITGFEKYVEHWIRKICRTLDSSRRKFLFINEKNNNY